MVDLIDCPHVQPRYSTVTRADWTSVIYSPGSENALRTHFIMILSETANMEIRSPYRGWQWRWAVGWYAEI